ncbi:putative spermidine/putrescine transport system permease protein [Cupriavidus gilardii J11]|uniref:Putative spermidine/putrescine transport system permease protein n=1 Tax=Cupriavidus gilardii J11 TaxID=936133 RepID=A0A562B8E4_9BURK|nr:putative spermidine/putrescine transport system permease protein [Cupriavidus gilardii J11]
MAGPPVSIAIQPPETAGASPQRTTKARPGHVPRGIVALALVAPLLLFLLATFVVPVAVLLARSVDNREVGELLTRTASAMREWDGAALPDEGVVAALATDLRAAPRDRVATVARVLNGYRPGFRSLLIDSARTFRQAPATPSAAGGLAALVERHPAWGDIATWRALKRALPTVTDHYLLAALDLRRDDGGALSPVPADSAIYRDVLARTFTVSLSVTVGCLLLGYPLAYLMCHASPRVSRVLLLMVLLPFWTSLLVRTAAWTVVLQDHGVVNGLLAWLGLVDPAHPLKLMYNRVGVLIAMIHILLPFMVLPLHGTMKTIPASFRHAAASLGAPPWRAFVRVYLPLTLPGIAAGTLLVFMLALGYYITPALVGGTDDQMLSHYIAYFANQVSNWGMAAALGTVLLAITVVLYAVFQRVAGVDRLRIG